MKTVGDRGAWHVGMARAVTQLFSLHILHTEWLNHSLRIVHSCEF